MKYHKQCICDGTYYFLSQIQGEALTEAFNDYIKSGMETELLIRLNWNSSKADPEEVTEDKPWANQKFEVFVDTNINLV